MSFQPLGYLSTSHLDPPPRLPCDHCLFQATPGRSFFLSKKSLLLLCNVSGILWGVNKLRCAFLPGAVLMPADSCEDARGSKFGEPVCRAPWGFRGRTAPCLKLGVTAPNSRHSHATSTAVVIKDLAVSHFLDIFFKSTYFSFTHFQLQSCAKLYPCSHMLMC